VHATIWAEDHVSAVGQRGLWFDLVCDLVEDTEIPENDLQVDMKIASQFIASKNVESAIVGAGLGQIERIVDISTFRTHFQLTLHRTTPDKSDELWMIQAQCGSCNPTPYFRYDRI
jgi:hypothetical protein